MSGLFISLLLGPKDLWIYEMGLLLANSKLCHIARSSDSLPSLASPITCFEIFLPHTSTIFCPPFCIIRCTSSEEWAEGSGTAKTTWKMKFASLHKRHNLASGIFPKSTANIPYNLCLKGKQGTQAQGWALAPGHTTRLGAQPGWGERQTSISTPGLFPSLLPAVGSPFCGLHRSVSLLCFRSTNTSPGKWEPQTVARDERQQQISGENRAGKAYLKGCTEKENHQHLADSSFLLSLRCKQLHVPQYRQEFVRLRTLIFEWVLSGD